MQIQYFTDSIIMNIAIILFFFVFLMLSTIFIVFVISLFKKKHYKEFQPEASVIIPSYNEEKNIQKCLLSIFNSNYPLQKLEVIVVDDKSTDNTRKIVEKLQTKYDIKILTGQHKGKSEALNLGIKHSTKEYIITIDADTFVEKNFVTQVLKPFADRKVGATNAVALIKNPKTLVENFQAVEYGFNNLIRKSFSELFQNGIWFFGASACFRKDVLMKVGNFRKNVLTEDLDISLRIFDAGYDIITADAYSYTEPCRTWAELFRQRLRWFTGGLQCSTKHRKMIRKASFAVGYLFVEKYFWAFYSVISLPLITYQVFYWMPKGFFNIVYYIVRWFSIFGPFHVIYMIPQWGLSLSNIFGVSTGIISSILIIAAIIRFNIRINIQKILAIIFYFPYTIFLNLALAFSIIRFFKNRTETFSAS